MPILPVENVMIHRTLGVVYTEGQLSAEGQIFPRWNATSGLSNKP